MLNIEQLQKRKRQLCGETRTVPAFNVNEDLAAILKLSLDHRPITDESILFEKMEVALDRVSPELKPFCEAIIILFKNKI
jgi:hypothetical protein